MSNALQNASPQVITELGTNYGQQLERLKEQANAIRALWQDVMMEGEDYGKVPGVDKAFLHKPGAEKICILLQATATYDIESTEQYESDPPFFAYRVRCILTHRASGEVLGEGVGSANTYESKYRYRTEWWNHRGDPPENQGWQRTKKAWRRRSPNPDTADHANTCLKMAKKRAFVDAALTVGAVSSMFSQDPDTVQVDRDMLRSEQAHTGQPEASAEQLEQAYQYIHDATDEQALQAAAAWIAQQGFPDEARGDLKRKYTQRRAELRDAEGAAGQQEMEAREAAAEVISDG